VGHLIQQDRRNHRDLRDAHHQGADVRQILDVLLRGHRDHQDHGFRGHLNYRVHRVLLPDEDRQRQARDVGRRESSRDYFRGAELPGAGHQHLLQQAGGHLAKGMDYWRGGAPEQRGRGRQHAAR
jgi:hypothetical protein